MQPCTSVTLPFAMAPGQIQQKLKDFNLIKVLVDINVIKSIL